jgi:hypothetical protein
LVERVDDKDRKRIKDALEDVSVLPCALSS